MTVESCYLSLLSLPKEILFQILQYLDYEALHAFCGVSRKFSSFLTKNNLWKHYALQDESTPFEKVADYKVICKLKHIGQSKIGSEEKIIHTVGRMQISVLRCDELKLIMEELKQFAHISPGVQRKIKNEGIVRTLAVVGRIHVDDEQLMSSLMSFFFTGSDSIYLHDKEGLEAQHTLKEEGMLETALSIFKMHKGGSSLQLLNYLCSFLAHQSIVEGTYLIQIGLIDEIMKVLKSSSNAKVISPVLRTLLSFAKHDLSLKENLPVVIFEVLVSFITKDQNITVYCLSILEAVSHFVSSGVIVGLSNLLESIIMGPNLSWAVQLKAWIVYSKISKASSKRLLECLKYLSTTLKKAPIVELSEALTQMSSNKEIVVGMVGIGMMRQVIEIMSRCSNAIALNNLCSVLLNASQVHDEVLEDVFAARIMDNVISICEAGQKSNSLEAAKKLHQKSNFFRLF